MLQTWGVDDGKSSISSVFQEVTVTEARVILTIVGASGVWQACWHLGTDYEKLVMQAECLLNQL